MISIEVISGINFIFLLNQPSVIQQILDSVNLLKLYLFYFFIFLIYLQSSILYLKDNNQIKSQINQFELIIYLFYFNKQSICLAQYGDSYVKGFPSVKCDQSYLRQSYFILYPLFAVWSIILPLFLLYKIYNIRYRLNRFKNLKKFGIFYFEYKEKFYYWEFVKIYLKLSLVIVNNLFLDSQNPLKASIICLILLLYSISTNILKPNDNETQNQLEQLIYICCSVSVGLCCYISEEQTAFQNSSKIPALQFLL
ncbi:transmembrane protein, putative (macronuclear) [Tetrahymena thermophila SB210]|uniref:Transmembrane protein, putative n=1 Tax=Tetrahymena thermophila (strain SB210) TaxID=312017 RepID=W7X087_TETTS|nr:transmembrane protein, putative [Tetrahymena thermophila SB210]EWS71282.1 transmembrane protein, putative [Tetrahymena thermophila SB210]|eukprot:XP_012656188.1 transmembrane protein, putative [Tetrahymena thermophila SB210]